MVTIVVGINLIPAVVGTIEEVQAVEEVPSGVVSGLLDVLPFVFVAAVLLGSVAWIGGSSIGDGGTKEVKIKIQRNSRRLVSRLNKASSSLGEYINNLDVILGIKTVLVETNSRACGLYLSKEKKELDIEPDTTKGGVWDWYLVDRNPDATMFKVVGLHKEDASNNVVYVLGTTNKTPYLIKVPNENINRTTRQEWIELAKVN